MNDDVKGPPQKEERHETTKYWRRSRHIVLGILSVWFVVAYVGGIFFKEDLDAIQIGHAPLGFWIAQQGAIIVFVILLVVYTLLMNRLDQQHGYREDD